MIRKRFPIIPQSGITRTHGIWSASTIFRIWADERYTGVYVIGKRAVLEVGGTRSRLKDRESWYIIPDHHPAIIEKAVFIPYRPASSAFLSPTRRSGTTR
jgi:site-specific DNA recombinase